MTTPNPFVLHVRSATGHGGGPEKTILNSPRFLRPLGFESACAYLHHTGDGENLAQRAEQAGARFISVPDRWTLDVTVIPKLARICRENNVAIWHAHDYKTNVLGLLVRRIRPMKLVSTVHGWGVLGKRLAWYYKIDKYALRHYDQVICVSEDLHAECLRVGVDPARCHFVHNAIDTEQFVPLPPKSASDVPPADSSRRILIGALARLSPEKGFERLVQATATLIAQGHDLELRIAGEGPSRANIESHIAGTGRQDRIRLLGHVRDTVAFLQGLDIFVLSSLREGLPNSLLEAMACGLPVIATRVGGVPSLVQDAYNGLLIKPDSTEEIAEAIASLAMDKARRIQLGTAARQTIECSYNFADRMRRIAAIYERVLARTPAGAG